MTHADPLISELKSLRETLRMPQTDIAARLGQSQASVSNWESGRHAPRGAARIVLGQIVADLRAMASEAPMDGC